MFGLELAVTQSDTKSRVGGVECSIMWPIAPITTHAAQS